VIQAPKAEGLDQALPMLPDKPRGAPRVDDRRVLNGIFWVLRSGAPWRDLPSTFGPYTTCYNRFVRGPCPGVWRRIIGALAAAHDATVQMTDTSIVCAHQHGACLARLLQSVVYGFRSGQGGSRAGSPPRRVSHDFRQEMNADGLTIQPSHFTEAVDRATLGQNKKKFL
jgi:transposase